MKTWQDLAFPVYLVCWDPPTEEDPTMSKTRKGKLFFSVTVTATKLVPDNGTVAVRQHSPSTTYLRAGQPWPYCKPSICVGLFVFVRVCVCVCLGRGCCGSSCRDFFWHQTTWLWFSSNVVYKVDRSKGLNREPLWNTCHTITFSSLLSSLYGYLIFQPQQFINNS